MHFIYVKQSTYGCIETLMDTFPVIEVAGDVDDSGGSGSDDDEDDKSLMSRSTYSTFWFPC